MNNKTIKTKQILMILFLLVLSLSGCGPGTDTPPEPTPTPQPSTISDTFGIVWSSSFHPEGWDINIWPTQLAADVGARWDRWPLEWARIEPSPGQFLWSGENHNYDVAVDKDRGTSPPLNLLIVLGSIPNWFDLASLEEPAFLDGTTQPNPDNQWGYFVHQASLRYPSTTDSAIAWKIGNEAPAKTFKDMSMTDYVEFVSVACEVLAITDPQALIVLGAPEHGMGVNAVNGEQNWYWSMLRELRSKGVDSCIDAIAFHAYGGAQHSEYLAVGGYDLWKLRTEQETGIPVWMTETGVAHASAEWCYEPNKPPCATESETSDYVIQNYVWMLQGAAKRGYEGKVFHHHFRDTNSSDIRDGPWGLLHIDTTPYPAYYAIQLVIEKLNNAQWYADESQEGYYHRIVFLDQKGTFINVVWAVQGENPVPASAGILLAHEGMSVATVYEITDTAIANPRTLSAVSGGAGDYYPLELPAATAQVGGPPYPGIPMIGGHTYIFTESPDSISEPTGSASLICENGKVVGTQLTGYDEFSGLASLTQVCSPAKTYDLSWTQPGRLYAGTVRTYPPKGSTCTLTLTNKAGLTAQQTLSHPEDACGGGNDGGGSSPGGDHPDDNAAATGAVVLDAFFAVPEGARAPSRIAILNQGFAHDLWRWVLEMGEPVDLVGLDFAPETVAAQYPVLLIPSGGLFGLENDTGFRARLEEYTRLGGTLLTFAQQHGYEYSALPGREVGGYDWDEDISCFRSALHMETWHPILYGFTRATLTVHVDGYFDRWPQEAQILLSRTANGQPSVLRYPFGEGQVIAGSNSGLV